MTEHMETGWTFHGRRVYLERSHADGPSWSQALDEDALRAFRAFVESTIPVVRPHAEYVAEVRAK